MESPAIIVQSLETYNLSQLILTFILIAWGMYAYNRFHQTLLIRASIMCEQHSVIRGEYCSVIVVVMCGRV